MLTLDDIERAETNLWVKRQLDRLQELVLANGEDPEMLEAIEFLREENEWWSDPKADQAINLGRIALGAGGVTVN
jgi:hypothetical protein